MNNLFSKYKITKGLRMYPTDEGNNKIYGKDVNYFVTVNTGIIKGDYTIVGNWYSYALLNMYGETISSEFCTNHKTSIRVDDDKIKSITMCGRLEDLSSLMCLDVSADTLPMYPQYVENEYDKSIESMRNPSGTGTTIVNTVVSSYLANDFTYNDFDNSYSVSSLTPSCDGYDNLFDSFLLYTNNIDHIKKGSRLKFFNKYFNILHVNGQEMENDLEAVPNVLTFFVNKNDGTARMMYSFNMTTQTGLGLEDIWMDVEGESNE